MKLIGSGLTLLLVAATLLFSCQKEKLEPSKEAPTITFSQPDAIYIVKVGKSITIEPLVEHDYDALYSWTTSTGELIGREKVLTYSWEEAGENYITFKVITNHGSAEEEIRVDVANLVPPTISLSVPKEGYNLLLGEELNLSPIVNNNQEATYEWKVDNRVVATTGEYTFKGEKRGHYLLSLATQNEDGSDYLEFSIDVKSAEEMPFSWLFESKEYSLSLGRKIKISPFAINNAFDAEYIWSINGEEVQRGGSPHLIFTGEKEGVYSASVTMTNSYFSTTEELTVTVSPPEGSYKRAQNGSSSSEWNRVYEYLPAPGQFINEGWSATTMEEACSYAESQLTSGGYISLGGWGGYIVLGFDHSIENDGGYNFQIIGNSFEGSSEPGIIYVMQDENGDGLANDTWYELKGSEFGKAETIQEYEVTYYRPRAVGMPVSWSDNLGNSGTVDYLQAYHRQDYYYPLWVKEDSYTLKGTRLESRTQELSPGYWSNDHFEWGYADNFSPIDRLTDDDNYSAGANANHFKISDAVTFEGKPANLQYIDFVKIQTGVNAKAGWLGENSTEVFGAKDYNMIKADSNN